MRVLVVHSGNHAHVAPFIAEQAEALREAGCEVQLFAVEGHGMRGYLRCLPMLKKAIADFRPDIVHAHYGLCGLLCTLQRQVPVVVTYHGSDINDRHALPFSVLAARSAKHNILVSNRQRERLTRFVNLRDDSTTVLPCGINLDNFIPLPQGEAREKLGLGPDVRYVLFAGAFDIEVKNAPLAQAVCKRVEKVMLVELKGYNRCEVALLMSAADCLLMTSHSEGSPQVIKEAMAFGLPIVSVDVGDVAELTAGVEGCYVADDRTVDTLAGLLSQALAFGKRTAGRTRIVQLGLDNTQVAEKLIAIYQQGGMNNGDKRR
jgi:glycosyltransferase involved in cell wall biosynthesis